METVPQLVVANDHPEPSPTAADFGRALIQAGFSCIPIRPDGSKAPAISEWRPFMAMRMTPADIDRLFPAGCGVAIIGGAVSGGLEIIDVEGHAPIADLTELIEVTSPGLLARLPRVRTPSGGLHIYLRCETFDGNQKLARGPDGAVLIETRGEGGYVLAPSSPGACHRSGKTYALLPGARITQTPPITPDEREALLDCCRSFNSWRASKRREMDRQSLPQAPLEGTPGSDYARRGDVLGLLESRGWRVRYHKADKAHLTRPGKKRGTSAVWHANDRCLYVFSSNAHPFDSDRAYNPFAIFALLEHGGDFQAAARALKSMAYGEQSERAVKPAARDAETKPEPHAGTRREQAAAVPERAPEPIDAHPGRPMIDAGIGDLPTARSAAVDALRQGNNPPRLFSYGGNPVRIERGDDGRLALAIGEHKMRHEMARAIRYYVIRGRNPVSKPVPPPMEVVRDVMAAETSPFPSLRAIVRAPTLRYDGSVLKPGYDAGTGLYLDGGDLEIPNLDREWPTARQIAAARSLIVNDLLGEFPFKAEADKANLMAPVLLPYVREYIEGPTPLHLIEKPTPGTGATLLAEVVTYPATGRLPGSLIEGRDDDEWRKRLTATLLGSPAYALIDNLRRPLDSPVLASALTASFWEDRLLGTNTQTRLAVRCTWIATGNNPTLSQEMARRTVSIRLDAKMGQPWLRDGFRHPDLRRWVKANRSILVWAGLVLARAWWCAGQPEPSHGRRLGMYEDYSRVMGGVLEVAGITGFLANLNEFYKTSDIETSAKRAFLCDWRLEFGDREVGVADLFPLAARSDLHLGEKGERSQKTRLGKELGKMRDCRFSLGGSASVLVERLDDLQGVARYRLRELTS